MEKEARAPLPAPAARARDYTCVTETPGDRITREALAMLYTRYAFGASLAAGKDVLEVACGSGGGLGYLARQARRVVGGDVTEGLLRRARTHYNGRVPLLRLDAHALPFAAASFDVIILYEAIYYLASPDAYLEECRRVLRPGGLVLVCTVNKEWPDFNPSPFSVRYYSAVELAGLLGGCGFQPEIYAAFPANHRSVRDHVVSRLKRTAVRLHLVPRSMKGKAWLKQLFLGDLVPAPPEVTEGMAAPESLRPVEGDAPVRGYKVLYAVGRAR
jgi:ubiquinone/menaquinone biosynthesis C-methylase UbiE